MTDRQLFANALLDADKITEQKYFTSDFSYEFSAEFERKMEKLIAKEKRIKLRTRKKISRALLAAIITILILFTGLMSVSASREKLFEFVDKKKSHYTQIILSENSTVPLDTIEITYTLTDLPEGYELYQYQREDNFLYEIWKNQSGNEIVFTQEISDIDISIDNEHYYQEIVINGYKAYIIGQYGEYQILWTDGNYWFSINVTEEYKDNLIDWAEKIIVKN